MATTEQIYDSSELQSDWTQVTLPLARPLRILSPRQIACIDRLLAEIGPYGEVRLVKKKGQLRFIQRVESEDAP